MQRAISIAFVAGLLAPLSKAQCDDWLDGFSASVASGVFASTVWTSGGVDRLVFAYGFGEAGNTVGRSVVAWDGADWDNLNGGLVGGAVSVATFDDGAGDMLYVGGALTGTAVGAIALQNIARWNGSSWSNVSGGVTGSFAVVNAMTVFDDGSGPALYVAGRFSAAGGLPATNVARWNGSSWSSVGSGLSGEVLALSVFDDGGGAKLYASGFAGGTLSAWNGVSWSSVPGAPNFSVYALATLDLGAGEQLFVGGDFTLAGGASATRVASWNGANWTTYGAGLPARVLSFATYDSGAGARLLAGGQFSLSGQHAIAEWNGSSWSALAGGIPVPSSITSPASVWTMREFTVGVQPVLVAGGGYGLRYLYEGTWRTVASAPTHVPHVLVDYDDGSSAAPFSISRPPTGFPVVGTPVVWKHEQMRWSPVPGSPCGVARALVKFDDGSGERLFVGGSLDTLAGAPANDVQVYDGSSWSPLGAMPDFDVYDVEWFDAGNGPRLYAAGAPKVVSGNPTIPGFVIVWNGVSWSAFGGPDASCVTLESYDDGAGTKLYVGGFFSTLFPSTSARGIAKWNGATWSAVGPGLTGFPSGTIQALARWNDGTGEKLFIGGLFGGAGGVPNTVNIASWDGANFAPLGIGWSFDVRTLAVDTGTTPSTLVAGGTYSTLPGQNGARERGGLMRWDGSSWSHYDGGLDQSSFSQVGSSVSSVVVADVGDGVDLLVSGSFRQLGGTFSPFFGVWNRCTAPGEPYCFGSGADTLCACLNASPVQDQAGCVNSSGRAALLRGDGSASVAQNDLTLRTHGMPPAKSCILFVGTDAPNGGAGALFDDGLRCAGGTTRRLGLRTSDSLGFATWGPGLNAQGAWLAGQTRYLQTWYRDPSGPCDRGSNLSNGYRVALLPELASGSKAPGADRSDGSAPGAFVPRSRTQRGRNTATLAV